MSAHLIFNGPDEIDGLEITVDMAPRVNEHVEHKGLVFRVIKVSHLLGLNRVRVEVIHERTWSRA